MISMKISVLPLPVTPCKRFGLYILDLIAVFRLPMTISCSSLYNIFFFDDLNYCLLLSSNFLLNGLKNFFEEHSKILFLCTYFRGCQIGMQGPQLFAKPRHFFKLDVATSRMAFLDLNLHVLQVATSN